MKARILLPALVLTAPILAQPPAVPEKQRLTLAQTVPGRPGSVLFYSGVPSVEWAPDGEHLVVEQGEERVWLDPVTGETKPAPGPDPEEERRADLAQALLRLPEVAELGGGRGEEPEDDALERRARGLARGARPKGADAQWLKIDGDLYFHRRGGPVRRLTEDGARKREVELSPDARWIAFERDHDLFVVDTETGEERAISSDGGPELFYGRLDWVYQEEVYERGNFKGFWWSPTADGIVFYRLDESPVREFAVVDHVPDPDLEDERFVHVERENYPKVGTPNPIVSLGIVRPEGGEPVWVDLSGYDDDILVVRAGWTPDGEKVTFQVQDRIQTWLDLSYADPETGEVTRVLREEAGPELGWVNILGQPRWLPDGTFLWLSDRTGTTHVYHYRPDGALIRAVTEGDWVVEEIVKVDAERGLLWFTGTKDGAIEDNLYRVGLDGEGLVRLTPGPGTHDVTMNDDASLLLDEFSSLRTPPELRLLSGEGELLGTLQKGLVPAMQEYLFRERELLQIPARDGFLMDATMLVPAGLEAGQKAPILVDTYSGPNLRTVRDSWNRGADAFHQFLAQNGVAVLQVNNRSSSGKGQKYTAAAYRNFGKSELRDLIDAIDWVGEHYPWADTDRVGITGWSYGGTMSAYALTHSDRFALGLAGAGVYDWRLYDTIYTERYMQTPELNPDGYRESSVIANAKDLDGHLVLVHGTMDDNVHLQNAMHLVYALQQAGKDFELMVYPKSRHGVRDSDQRWHMRRLYWRAIQEHLLGVPATEIEAARQPVPATDATGGGPRVR